MPYETATITAEASFRRKKGEVEFAEVRLRIAPIEGRAVKLKSEVRPEDAAARFLPACLEGIRERIQSGVIAGCPIEGIEVTILRLVHRPDVSTDESFRLTGGFAFRVAFQNSRPELRDE